MTRISKASTVVHRDFFPGCSVAAELDRIGQGMEWGQFLERALNDSLVTWAMETSYGSAVVGHTNSLNSLAKHISTFAAKSYLLGSTLPVNFRPFTTPGKATGQIKKQSCSADQYAFITIQAEPNADSNSVQLVIPESEDIASELHAPDIQEAILDGIFLAALSNNFAQPLVGFEVTVVEAKWHPVDSYSGVFKRATCKAMSDIIGSQDTLAKA